MRGIIKTDTSPRVKKMLTCKNGHTFISYAKPIEHKGEKSSYISCSICKTPVKVNDKLREYEERLRD